MAGAAECGSLNLPELLPGVPESGLALRHHVSWHAPPGALPGRLGLLAGLFEANLGPAAEPQVVALAMGPNTQHPARAPQHEAIAIPEHAVTRVGFQLLDREQVPGHMCPTTHPGLACTGLALFGQSGRPTL